MSQDLVSSVPGVFAAMLSLVQAAAAAQSPPVAVFAFELGEYEPGSYVTLHKIQGPQYEWENLGVFSQRETYEISGCATVFSGDSPATNPSVAVTVLQQTIDLFQACVMTPVMSNRTMPILGTTGPSPVLMVPARMGYSAGPGIVGKQTAGWAGVYDFAFRFEAIITPA